MLKIKNLKKNYGDFFLDCSLEVKSGQITGLIGQNGSGKSTTFKSILGLVYPDGGNISIFGKDYRNLTVEDKESKKKRGISDQKRNIVCAIDEHNNKVIQVSERGRIHTKNLYEIYKDKIPSQCTVVSDSLRSYHGLMKKLGVKWIKIPFVY